MNAILKPRPKIKNINKKELSDGIKVEMEHTDDKEVAKTIALQHLAENSKYYSKLKNAGLADELSDAKSKLKESFNLFIDMLDEDFVNKLKYETYKNDKNYEKVYNTALAKFSCDTPDQLEKKQKQDFFTYIEDQLNDKEDKKKDILITGELTTEGILRLKINNLIAEITTKKIKLDEYVKKDGNMWKVYSKAGKVLGTHPDKKSADSQLRAIEANKHESLLKTELAFSGGYWNTDKTKAKTNQAYSTGGASFTPDAKTGKYIKPLENEPDPDEDVFKSMDKPQLKAKIKEMIQLGAKNKTLTKEQAQGIINEINSKKITLIDGYKKLKQIVG